MPSNYQTRRIRSTEWQKNGVRSAKLRSAAKKAKARRNTGQGQEVPERERLACRATRLRIVSARSIHRRQQRRRKDQAQTLRVPKQEELSPMCHVANRLAARTKPMRG